MNNIREHKNELRRKFSAMRDEMPPEYRERVSRNIARKFFSTLAYRECDTVLLYYPIKSELDTLPLFSEIISGGRILALPKCNPADSSMTYYEVASLDDLVIGAYGIPEPKPEKALGDTRNAVCILPALAYDANGYRLGYGKGYYDRYLNGFYGKKVGLVYSGFLVDNLPHGRYDKTADLIITEKGVYTPNAR